MNEFSVEQKLELVRNLRSMQNDNTMKIRKRKELLYPDSSHQDLYHQNQYINDESGYQKTATGKIKSPVKGLISLKLRVVFCFLVFLLFFYMDIEKRAFFSIDTQKIETALTTPFEIKSIDFIKQFPYTLSNDKK